MTKIEVTFLGTTASIPTPERNHPSIYLKYTGKEEDCVLFDCGEATQRQIFRAGLNFMRLNHIFITHWHADHFAGLFGIIETMSLEKRKRPLYVYGPDASRFMGMISGMSSSSFKGFSIIPVDVNYTGSGMEKILEQPEYSVLSTPVRHGVPAVAYAFCESDRLRIDTKKASDMGLPVQSSFFSKLKEKGSAVYKGRKIMLSDISNVSKGKKIVYSGDTQPCRNIVSISENADLLIIDCTYFEDMQERHHTNLSQAIEIARKSGAKKTILTHISRRYQSHAELEKTVSKEISSSFPEGIFSVAKDFMKVVVE